MPAKPVLTPNALTPRDRAVCDGFAAGETRKALGVRFGVTKERIGQILNQPGAILYLLTVAGNGSTLLYARSVQELLTRLEWGGVHWDGLVNLLKAVKPRELAVTLTDKRAEAEAIAAEIGKPELVDQIHADLLISQEVKR